MSTQPVDVLAELRRAAADEREWGDRDDAERLSEAVAAVAELIEAAKRVIENEDEPRFIYGSIRELRAALARCGGQP